MFIDTSMDICVVNWLRMNAQDRLAVRCAGWNGVCVRGVPCVRQRAGEDIDKRDTRQRQGRKGGLGVAEHEKPGVPINNNCMLIDENGVPINNNCVPINNNDVPINNNYAPINNNYVPINNNDVPINNNCATINNYVPINDKYVPF